jgi:hypothetical protein
MPKRRQSRSRRHRRSQRGGNYTSASTYGSYVNGTGDQQFSRTFDQSGPYANRIGSEYVGAQGQNAQQPGTPTNTQLVQSAGRGKSKRGGLWGEVINQAIVPLSILGMQQTYRKKHGGRRHRTRRHRRH